MILIDTAVWIDHLRKSNELLRELLHRQQVLSHPLVIGELAMGSFQSRASLLHALQQLPSVIAARDAEVLEFVTTRGLFGRGLGYIDAHLLASATITDDTRLWTPDKRLMLEAEALGVAFSGHTRP